FSLILHNFLFYRPAFPKVGLFFVPHFLIQIILFLKKPSTQNKMRKINIRIILSTKIVHIEK
ncbi:MAG: hypothetical protein RSE18_14725, partial [Acinetobacter sp.]